MNQHPLNTIKESDKDLFAMLEAGRELAFKDGEINRKNKLLIALAIDAAKNAENGVRSLAAQAIAAGATKNEIIETLRIVYHICGAGSIYTASAALKDIL